MLASGPSRTVLSLFSAFHSRSCQTLAKSTVRTTTSLNNEQVRKKRSQIFTKEKQKQIDAMPRVEKIEVQYTGSPEDTKLMLNKGLSTPFNIAQHLTENIVERSALAYVNGQVWDLHRPLEEDCTVELLHFHDYDPFHVNRAFWRSCSFMLGDALESVFKTDIFVELHSFPAPHVGSGSFLYDVDLKMDNWNANKEELMVLSAKMHRLAEAELPFERLTVDASVALDMFAENQYKVKQIPAIAGKSQSGNDVTLYRVGDHVDISGGPMVANTCFLGRRCTIASAHKIEHEGVPMYRFQGVALPKGIFLNHFAFGLLEKRALKLNTANLPASEPVSPS